MTNLSKISKLVVMSLIISASFIFAQDNMEHSKMNDVKTKSCCSSDSGKSICTMDKGDVQEINVEEFDKNRDGRVYQCAMCPEQISDDMGRCTKCEMELKEVSVAVAGEKLGHSTHKMDHSKMMKKEASIVREGVIDVEAIDKNKDGKVFQDPMDWNVISDEAGRCPLCEMKLKEVSVGVAKQNLKKYRYKVK